MVPGEMVGRARRGVRGLNGLACGAGQIRKLVSLG